MIRRTFEGFSAVVPEGWGGLLDEPTYSDLDSGLPTRFAPPGDADELIITMPPLHPDDQPGADTEELEALAREWGMRRGIDEPLAVSTEIRQGTARASASYRIGDEWVEVWFVSDGAAMLVATYVCPWSGRDRNRAAREALLGSLRFT